MPEPRTLKIDTGTLVTLVVVAIVGLALLSAGITSQTFVCRACHAGEVAAATKGPHASTRCYACHLEQGWWSLPGQKAREWTVMYPAKLSGHAPGFPIAETARGACLRCHESLPASVSNVRGIRIAHGTCAPGGTCDTCHSDTGHPGATLRVTGPVMEDCVACHNVERAPIACDSCHDEKTSEARQETGPWQITHGPNWESTHGMGRLDSCVVCHAEDFCVRCHGVVIPHKLDFGASHGKSAKAAPKSCASCHRSRDLCDACHGIEMPHPAGFLKEHDTIAKSRNDASCLRCHATNDCADCHAQHIHPGNAKVFAPQGGR